MYALLFLALIPSAPAPRESPKDLDKLQGIWKVTAMESRGILRPVAVGNAGQARAIVIAGDAFAWTTVAGTLKIDSKKKTVDLVVTEGRYKGEVIPGLYELSGNTLKLAVPSPLVRLGNVRTAERPAELKTGPETRHSLYTFERDVTATKAEAAAKLKERKENVAAQGAAGLPGGGPAGGIIGGGGPAGRPNAQLRQELREIIERLDRIEKRLDQLEKSKETTPPEKK